MTPYQIPLLLIFFNWCTKQIIQEKLQFLEVQMFSCAKTTVATLLNVSQKKKKRENRPILLGQIVGDRIQLWTL